MGASGERIETASSRSEENISEKAPVAQFRQWSPAAKAFGAVFVAVLVFFGLGIIALSAFVAWTVVAAVSNPLGGDIAAGMVVAGLCGLAIYTGFSK